MNPPANLSPDHQLAEAGAETQCAWAGITRRFLDDLIAKYAAAKEAA